MLFQREDSRVPEHMRREHGMSRFTEEVFKEVFPDQSYKQIHTEDHGHPESDFKHSHRERDLFSEHDTRGR